MWTPIGLGHGRLATGGDHDPAARWVMDLRVDAAAAAVVLTLADADTPAATTAAAASPGQPAAASGRRLTLQLRSRPGEPLPEVTESYQRGDDFLIVMPQSDSSRWGLTLQARLLQADREHVVAELLIAVQTDLLDCHPTLLLCSPPGSTVNLPAAAAASQMGAGGELADAADACEGPGQVVRLRLPAGAGDAALLFGPGDGAVEAETADARQACFHLFDEFLEKGVIRKARPWVALWRDAPPTDDQLAALLQQRCCSPLPLTT